MASPPSSSPLLPAHAVLNSASLRYRSFCQTNISGVSQNQNVPESDTSRSTRRRKSTDLAGRIPGRLLPPQQQQTDPGTPPVSASTVVPTATAMASQIQLSEQEPLTRTRTPDQEELQCCCGRPGCAYLEHNNVALAGIEKDLERAAVMGQALLSRHESYVAESQQETDRLNDKIAELESERTLLQTANDRVVAENRDLLSKLDGLNKAYGDSDATVKSLERLLVDTETEVRRLTALARRAEELEEQVQEMDRERIDMMRKMQDGEQESKSTLARWRESERKLRQLENEVEKIEWEAKNESQKHEEVVSRLERERVLERELGGAEGRLKGAAAFHGIEAGTGGNVVSHFVRDILQDNANLQAGIVELKELLQSSNDEVQNLRQHVMHHQPVEAESNDQKLSASVPLDQEMAWDQPSPQQSQREVHVHHHYHAKLAAKGNRTPTVRRTPRRKATMPAGMYLSTPESSVPSTPTSRPQRFGSSPIVPLRLNQPQHKNKRWSEATIASSISSMPSSPRSYFDRNSSIFDRLEAGEEESSRPTSPESNGFFSPQLAPAATQAIKSAGQGSFDAVLEDEREMFDSPINDITPMQEDSSHQEPSRPPTAKEITPKPSQMLTPSKPIDIKPRPHTPGEEQRMAALSPLSPMSPMSEPALPPETQTRSEEYVENSDPPTPDQDYDEEDDYSDQAHQLAGPEEDDETAQNIAVDAFHSSNVDDENETPIQSIPIHPSLHRSSSHDSLVSISGMDIHIAKRTPTSHSQTPSLLRLSSAGNRAHFAITPNAARSISAAQPSLSVTNTPAVISQRSFSSNFGNSETQGPAGRSLEVLVGGSPASLRRATAGGLLGKNQSTSPASSLGALGAVGGWVWSKWGVAPTPTRLPPKMKSVADLRGAALSTTGTNVSNAEVPVSRAMPGATSTGQSAIATPNGQSGAVSVTTSQTTLNPLDSASTPSSPSVSTGTPTTTTKGPKTTNDSLAQHAAFFAGRAPGINQRGAIPGKWVPKRTVSKLQAEVIDEEGLREVLAELDSGK